MAEGNTSSTITASISDLPQLPLLTIFDYIPLPNLLHIDEVCRAWKELKPEACSRRPQLIIANGETDLETLQPSCIESIRLPRLDGEETNSSYLKPKVRFDHNALFIGHSRPLQTILDRVLELMPNLKVFRLVQQHGSPKELSKVNQLLTHYRHQLVEVTIWFWGELSEGNQNRAEAQFDFQQMFLALMARLNRLTALRSLHVDFQSPPNCPVVLNDRQLTTHCLPDVVGRLTCLKFRTRLEFSNSNNSFKADVRLLKQILFRMRDGEGADKAVVRESAKLKQQPKKQKNLELYVSGTPLTLRTLISLGPGPVAAGLRTVEIGGVFSAYKKAEYKALARFVRQSPHLQALTIRVKSSSIHRLVESLVSLQELVYLNICCLQVFSPPEKVNIDQLPVLPSVKLLELHFSSYSHRDYEQLHLEVLLPNLTTVLWNHIGVCCPDCGYLIQLDELVNYQRDPNYLRRHARQFKADYGQQMQKCLRLARLAAFSRLPQLATLWVKVCPSGFVKLPFLDEAFTSHASLFRQTEFLFDKNSPSYVFYKD